nr:putative serine carboxypeptidase-like 23 [Tanacetum cinerariifolium]
MGNSLDRLRMCDVKHEDYVNVVADVEQENVKCEEFVAIVSDVKQGKEHPLFHHSINFSYSILSFRIWFKGTSESMFPIYRRLLAHRLPNFLYSGDTDPCVPAAGPIYALESMGLDVIEPWQKYEGAQDDLPTKMSGQEQYQGSSNNDDHRLATKINDASENQAVTRAGRNTRRRIGRVGALPSDPFQRLLFIAGLLPSPPRVVTGWKVSILLAKISQKAGFELYSNGLKKGHYTPLKPDVIIKSGDLAYYGSIGILKKVDFPENLKKVAVSEGRLILRTGKRFTILQSGDSDWVKRKNEQT